MSLFIRILIIFFIFFSTTSAAIEETTITYNGLLSQNNIQEFLKQVKGKNIKTLIISSTGGDVLAGMALGLWVFEHKIDVVVDKLCLSSCANYIFTAGHHKIIKDGAVVGLRSNIISNMIEENLRIIEKEVRAQLVQLYAKMPERHKHQEAIQKNIQQILNTLRKNLTGIKNQEEAFFKKIGVNKLICRVKGSNADGFYILSISEMEQFGIKNVQAPADYHKTDLSHINLSKTQNNKLVEIEIVN